MTAGPGRRSAAAAAAICACLAVAAAMVAACSRGAKHTSTPPRLLVVIVVDQMCDHHLGRFRDLYTGGFDRLLEGGAVFTNAWHDHAKTYTSPGHATISTGTTPSRHGIVANAWYDRKNAFAAVYSARDEASPVVGHPDRPGASPRQMLRDAVGDWLKAQSPRSKVYSVALKDYAAVMMGGRHPDGVYWFDHENGTYCSSTYYMDAYPAWVEAFNSGPPAAEYRDTVWTQSQPPEAYSRSRPDAFEAESDGQHTTFPYPIQAAAESQGEGFYDFFRNTPFADELTLRFASTMVAEEGLGADEVPDLLFVGCSAADFIGHVWGPYSQEAEDYYLRLDGYLEKFIARLDARVGRGHYTVVLTSDHGVDPFPEELAGRFEGAKRINRGRYNADLDSTSAVVARELGLEIPLIAHRTRGLVVDPTAARLSGVAMAQLRGRLAAAIRKLPYVEDVFTCDELLEGSARAGREDGDRDYYRLFRNSFHPDRSPDLYVLFKEHRLLIGGRTGTTHGSPHDYDRRVPLLFWGRGVRSVAVSREVHTVDVAPTICGLLGISPPGDIDGRALAAALANDPRGEDR
jgi:predicted AlkP superfamily pyrophosphatase or phosphodiesterase